MDLLDRYLHAVKFWLPRAQQDDIIAELREDIRSRIQEKEAELGHKRNDDGVAVILEERGHPMLVASRYLPQRALIGPVLTPAYWFIVRLVILWILVPVFVFVVGPVTLLAGKHPAAGLVEVFWMLLMAAVFAFGAITLVFAILERHPHEFIWKWDPRRLPRVPAPQPFPGLPPSAATGFAELVTGLAFTAMWFFVMVLHSPRFYSNGVRITLAPVWESFFWPVLLIAFSGIPIGSTLWLRPWWVRAHAIMRLAVDAVTLILTGALAKMGPWVIIDVIIDASGGSNTGVAAANRWVNLSMPAVFAVIGVIALVDAIQESRRLGAGGADLSRRGALTPPHL
jgi:hypothetical protein